MPYTHDEETDYYVEECCSAEKIMEENKVKTHNTYSFSNTTRAYINFCKYLDGFLREIYVTSDNNIKQIIDLFFTSYERNTLEWYMKEELERISKTNTGCTDSYLRKNAWLDENSHKCVVSNPVERVIIFITEFLTHDLEEQFYDINELKFGVKFTYDEYDAIPINWFSDEDDMYNCGYTNKASDYLEYLRKFAEMKMKENKNKEN